MTQKHEYTPVLDDGDEGFAAEETHLRPGHRPPRRSRASRWKPIIALVAFSLAIFASGTLLGAAIPESIKHSVWLRIRPQDKFHPDALSWEEIDGSTMEGTQCGGSWQEAEALGCHFDVMASRWYSPECFDQEALDAMLAEPQVNFTWYVDREHTAVVTREQALRGEFTKVWPDNAFHIKHCLYLWRRLHRAIINNKPIDEDLFDYGHTLHCTRMILKWMEPGFERHTISFQTSGRPFCRRNPLGFLASPRDKKN